LLSKGPIFKQNFAATTAAASLAISGSDLPRNHPESGTIPAPADSGIRYHRFSGEISSANARRSTSSAYGLLASRSKRRRWPCGQSPCAPTWQQTTPVSLLLDRRASAQFRVSSLCTARRRLATQRNLVPRFATSSRLLFGTTDRTTRHPKDRRSGSRQSSYSRSRRCSSHEIEQRPDCRGFHEGTKHCLVTQEAVRLPGSLSRSLPTARWVHRDDGQAA